MQPSPEVAAYAQSFRVGTNGLLTGFQTDLYVPTNAAIRWEIRRMSNNMPEKVLSSGSLSTSRLFLSRNSTNFVEFQPWYRGLTVTAGEELAIVLLLPDGFGWMGENGRGQYDLYSRGQHFALLTNGQWIADNDVDVGFRTFVVPEEPIPLLGDARISGNSFLFTVRCQSSFALIVERSADLSTWVPVHTNEQARAVRTIQLPRDGLAHYHRARVGALLTLSAIIPFRNIVLGGNTVTVDNYDSTNSAFTATAP